MSAAPPLVAIEWGTMRLRARLLDPLGRVIDARSQAATLAEMGKPEMAAALDAILSGWPSSEEPVLLSGMIGSAMGWREVPRVPCPADAGGIVAGIVADRIGGHRVLFVPGLSCRSRFGDPDVLRGEEMVAIGLLDTLGMGAARLLSVPGMHGKWMTLGAGAITEFSTAMTVDLHRLLAEHSILAPLMRARPDDAAAFAEGVARGAEGGGLARLLFAARSRAMLDGIEGAAASSYLWGVLIGADVREHLDGNAPVSISGDPTVAELFAAAIRRLGGEAAVIDTDAVAARGFMAVARQIGQLQGKAA